MALPPPVPFTEIVAMLLIWSKLLKKKPVCLSGPAKYTGQVNAVNWNSIIYDGCIIYNQLGIRMDQLKDYKSKLMLLLALPEETITLNCLIWHLFKNSRRPHHISPPY